MSNFVQSNAINRLKDADLGSSAYKDEIFYHVFQRSFYDSNGDGHGDLKGLQQKLDYLVYLGITSIILVPLYKSFFYHNYFADDFRAIDEKYGTLTEFRALVDAIHDKKMKIYLDMEVHYVAEDHLWFKDSFQNPGSKYSDFLIYNGPGNTEPGSIIFNLTELQSYNGVKKKVACLNLYNESVKQYLTDEFNYWTDPHGDGSLKHGVDGFRIDHMMDDLDEKGIVTNMFIDFWRPIFGKIRFINPEIKFMGEQADWSSYGEEYFLNAGIDYMFAFPLSFGFINWSKVEIMNKMDGTMYATPQGCNQLVFLENHDTNRFASRPRMTSAKLKVSAVLNILLGGLPCIYYGQELGMKGQGGFNAFGLSDGNDIPRREAFPWTATIKSEGIALWYKDTGPWWDQSELKDHDGISYEEQIFDTSSLLNWYRFLIQLRKDNSAFQNGKLNFIYHQNDNVLSFIRQNEASSFMIHLNLSEEQQEFECDQIALDMHKIDLVFDQDQANVLSPDQKINMQENGILIIKI